MRMVATRLGAHGFTAGSEDPEDYDARRLTITGLAGMHCYLTVEDCGYIECEYVPHRGWKADPVHIAGLVVSMLAGDSSGQRLMAGKPGLPGLPLRTVVGTELIAAGLDVKVDVYPDLTDFHVLVELVARHADHPERAEVCIGDDGSITMRCDRRDDSAEEIADSVRDAIEKFDAAVSLPPAREGGS